jgi:hypothetical protein
VKNTVYQVKINDLQHLKASVSGDVAEVTSNSFKQCGTRLNIDWIFVVPPREPTLKFMEKVVCSEKTLIVSRYNGVTHKCA